MEEDAYVWNQPFTKRLHDEVARRLGNITQAPPATGGVITSGKRSEMKETDKAVEILTQLRFDEAQAAEEAKAEEIVDAVVALNVAEIPDGIGVRFTKTYGGDQVYVHLAQRVVNDRSGRVWYVTGRQGPLTDLAFESLLAEKGGFGDFVVVYGQLDVKYDTLLRED